MGFVRVKVTWVQISTTHRSLTAVGACINGGVLTLGGYSGEVNDRLVDRLLGEQPEDGGWTCEAPKSRGLRFTPLFCILEGLLDYERTKGATTAVTEARVRGQEYLLERRMFRRRSTGEVVEREWMRFSFPTKWHYEVLRGLGYLRNARVQPKERLAEAVELLATTRTQDDRWLLQYPLVDGIIRST